MDEMKRMSIRRLETIIGAIEWDKKEVDSVWKKTFGAFEVH